MPRKLTNGAHTKRRDERHYHAFGKLTTLGNKEFWEAARQGFEDYVEKTIQNIGNNTFRKCHNCGADMPCETVYKLIRNGDLAAIRVRWACVKCEEYSVEGTFGTDTLREYYRQDNCS